MSGLPNHRPANHRPCRLSTYFDTHQAVMQQYRDGGFVGEDSLRFVDCHSVLLLQGEIACRGLIVITVTKLIDYVTDDADPLVQMEMYSYNVSVRGQGLAFRYDNQHPDELYPGHLDPHHRHTFDFTTNQELPDSPEWLGAEKWPTLGDVIGEAWDWHGQHYALLNHPGDFVPRDQLGDGLSR